MSPDPLLIYQSRTHNKLDTYEAIVVEQQKIAAKPDLPQFVDLRAKIAQLRRRVNQLGTSLESQEAIHSIQSQLKKLNHQVVASLKTT